MCIAAAQHVADKNLYGRFAIPAEFIPPIERPEMADERHFLALYLFLLGTATAR
jgi:hypothetical protein